MLPARYAANERFAVERERHEPCPRLRNRQTGQEGQDLDRVTAVGLDAGGVRRRVPAAELAVAAEDDLAVPPLPAVEVTRDAPAVAMREIGWRAAVIAVPGQ